MYILVKLVVQLSTIYSKNNFSISAGLDDLEDEIDEGEDPDIKQDSIYQLNLGHYLRDFLQNFSSHHGFPLFAQHLNANERKCLENINSF